MRLLRLKARLGPEDSIHPARVALSGESSFGWRRKVRHQLLNTVRLLMTGAARCAHAAFTHNDTTGGSAPYLWLQSEVAMHRGPMRKHESSPGGVTNGPKRFYISFFFFFCVFFFSF